VTRTTVNRVAAEPAVGDRPTHGAAIVRPMSHVVAVRNHYLRRFADPSEAAVSRGARAWAWALGETQTAPVTGRVTRIPPARTDIEAEIAVADERRMRGDQHNRVDGAATVLRWLIGDDDHVPVRTENRGELVGGFGDIVRSRKQIAAVLAVAAKGRRRAAAEDGDLGADPNDRRFARQDADYLTGVIDTLGWTLGRQDAPLSGNRAAEPTTRDIKMERVRAEDVIEQARPTWTDSRLPPLWYGEAVKFTINWLFGDRTAAPVDPSGAGPYGRDTQLAAMLWDVGHRRRRS
jgi:hypothetical protein